MTTGVWGNKLSSLGRMMSMRDLKDRQWEPAPEGHGRRYSHARDWPGAQGLMGDVIWDLCRGLSEGVNDLLKVTLGARSGQGVCSRRSLPHRIPFHSSSPPTSPSPVPASQHIWDCHVQSWLPSTAHREGPHHMNFAPGVMVLAGEGR